MLQRAEKSRLKTFGPNFLGSTDFPPALVEEIGRSDPAGVFLPAEMKAPNIVQDVVPAPGLRLKIIQSLNAKLKGKRILNLSGGSDKLVPYACGETFVRFLKTAIDPSQGWWKNSGLVFEDRVFDGVGHEMTPEMAAVAVTFIGDSLAGLEGGHIGKKSRM